MKLSIYFGNSVDTCTPNLLKQIVPNSLTEEFVVITPDRRTLITEQELFKQHNTQTFFNVNVTTFTRFASQTIREMEPQNKKLLTKASAIAIVKKIMLEHKNQFTALKKATAFNGTASAVFETISMFKSCNVSPNDLKHTFSNSALHNKIADLAFIYEQYEQFLQTDYTDSFNRLTLLSQLLTNKKMPNTHFLFVGFDDFTPQTYDILKKLVLNAKSVSVACAANPSKQDNYHLYTNNIYYNLLDLSKIIGIAPQLVECKPNYDAEKLWLSKNLFSLNPIPVNFEPNQMQIVKVTNKQKEVELVTKYIQSHILAGERWQDFAIVVPSLASYATMLKDAFTKHNIPFFLDDNQPFSKHSLVRFLLHLFAVVTGKPTQETVAAMLKCVPTLPQNQIHVWQKNVAKTGLEGSTLLKPLQTPNNPEMSLEVNAFLQQVSAFKQSIHGQQTVEEFCEQLLQFLTTINFQTMAEQLLVTYQETNNITQLKRTAQVASKIVSTLEELKTLLPNYETNFATFASILESYFENITLSLPPIEADTVFVADSAHSFMPNKNYVLVLGANSGQLPVALSDLGIIRDEELTSLKPVANLQPTVAYINKRNKLLLYEKLLKANKMLTICYCMVNEKGEAIPPSSFVEDLQNMVPNHAKNATVLLQGTYADVNPEIAKKRFLFNNPTTTWATQNLLSMVKDWYYFHTNPTFVLEANTLQAALPSELSQLTKNANFTNSYDNITNANELFFNNNTTSVSQFESFFLCPFEQFVKYGLKLQENLNGEMQANDIGNILHAFVAQLLPTIAKQKNEITQEELLELVNQTMEQVLNHENFVAFLNNPKQHNAILMLKEEALQLAQAMLYEQKQSAFVPTKLENKFGTNKQTPLKVETPVGTVYLSGIIDRVDYMGNLYRIVDYKTGKSDFSNFNEVASGKKLQLLVYLKAEQNENNQCVGVFYLPIKDEFLKDEKPQLEQYRLKGLVANNWEAIRGMDATFGVENNKSSILPLQLKKDGTFTKATEKFVLPQEDLVWLGNYAMSLIEVAYQKILSGNITPNPLSNGSYQYKNANIIGLNNFDVKLGSSWREVPTVPVFSKQDLVNQLNQFWNCETHYYDENLTKQTKE